ncbi:MAG: hypothetical protein H0T60_02325 [Acidobacteria bacterium]|nr:hypothetical protein [Acidobacteriota bacterium]
MNLEEALEVLNRHRHRGSDNWHVVPGLRNVNVTPSRPTLSPSWLSEFEAIAIAEKYVREGEA